jgi:hypothetical protein
MSVVLTGIVRGAFGKYGASFRDIYDSTSPVLVIKGKSLESVISGLALDEWLFTLRVNGRRVKDPMRYIERKVPRMSEYLREVR